MANYVINISGGSNDTNLVLSSNSATINDDDNTLATVSAQTQADLGVANAALAQTQADLGVANAALAQTQADLAVSKVSKLQSEFEKAHFTKLYYNEIHNEEVRRKMQLIPPEAMRFELTANGEAAWKASDSFHNEQSYSVAGSPTAGTVLSLEELKTGPMQMPAAAYLTGFVKVAGCTDSEWAIQSGMGSKYTWILEGTGKSTVTGVQDISDGNGGPLSIHPSDLILCGWSRNGDDPANVRLNMGDVSGAFTVNITDCTSVATGLVPMVIFKTPVKNFELKFTQKLTSKITNFSHPFSTGTVGCGLQIHIRGDPTDSTKSYTTLDGAAIIEGTAAVNQTPDMAWGGNNIFYVGKPDEIDPTNKTDASAKGDSMHYRIRCFNDKVMIYYESKHHNDGSFNSTTPGSKLNDGNHLTFKLNADKTANLQDANGVISDYIQLRQNAGWDVTQGFLGWQIEGYNFEITNLTIQSISQLAP